MVYLGPAEVLARLDDVHLVAARTLALERTWAVLGLKHQARSGLPRQALCVSMAVAPNLGPCTRRFGERVIRRHGTVVVEPQGLADQRIQLLRERPLGRIAGRHVQLAVRAEPAPHTGVIGRAGHVLDDRLWLGKLAARVPVTHHFDAFALFVIGVRDIDKGIFGKIGVKRDVHQAALTRRLDVRHDKYRLGPQFAILDNADAARPLGKDQVLIRQPRETPRHLKPRGDRLDPEPGVICPGLKDLVFANSGCRRTAGRKQHRTANYQNVRELSAFH